MTDNGPGESAGPAAGPAPSPMIARRLCVCGAERPRITRLSRKVLAGGSALALLLISGAVLWALRSNHPHNPAAGRTLQHRSSQCRRWLDNIAARTMPEFPAMSPGLGRHCRETSGVPSKRRKAKRRRLALMPNNSVPTRKPRQPGPARYLRRPLRPSRQPHAASQETANKTAPSSDETFTQNGQDQ